MCSFLLIFLLVIIAFDILHDSVVEWDIAPAPAQATSSRSQSLVLALQRVRSFTFSCAGKDSWNTGKTPLQRHEFDQTYFTTSQNNGGDVALEMQPVLQDQQEDCGKLCHMPWSLDKWGEAQYAAQADLASCRSQCMGRMVPIVGRPATELELESALQISFKSEHAQLTKLLQCQT